MSSDNILRMKRRIEEAKTEVSKIEGQLVQCNEDFGFESEEEFIKKLEELRQRSDELTSQIELGEQELMEKYFK